MELRLIAKHFWRGHRNHFYQKQLSIHQKILIILFQWHCKILQTLRVDFLGCFEKFIQYFFSFFSFYLIQSQLQINTQLQDSTQKSMSKLSRNYQIFTTASEHLHKICEPVAFPLSQQTLENIRYLKLCFRKSLKTSPTLGLAAPQVGINQRFFIIPSKLNYINYSHSVSVMQSMLRSYEVFINPIVIKKSEDCETTQQNCKSVFKFHEVSRPKSISVEYQNMNGLLVKVDLNGLWARIFQHQTDHLNGITIEDIGKPVEENKNQENPKENQKKNVLL